MNESKHNPPAHTSFLKKYVISLIIVLIALPAWFISFKIMGYLHFNDTVGMYGIGFVTGFISGFYLYCSPELEPFLDFFANLGRHKASKIVLAIFLIVSISFYLAGYVFLGTMIMFYPFTVFGVVVSANFPREKVRKVLRVS